MLQLSYQQLPLSPPLSLLHYPFDHTIRKAIQCSIPTSPYCKRLSFQSQKSLLRSGLGTENSSAAGRVAAMEVVRLSSSHLVKNYPRTTIAITNFGKPFFANFPHNPARRKTDKYKLYTAISPPSSTEPSSPPLTELETDTGEETFDWFAQWYPIMPVCDLDKRIPHAKKVMGIDVVVWWDRNENDWKVFNDMCPHRLAPLSEGRIDQWGRLQCVYHGWCFNGSGDCKFIPQAPLDGPPVHASKRACVGVYPSIVQHNIVWFWPNTDPEYKDILLRNKPPFIPELEDPSFSISMGSRDIAYGYEILIENLMDPAHVPYSHYKIIQIPQSKPRVKADREGGRPLDLAVKKIDINGFVGKQDWGSNKFIAPCIFYSFPNPVLPQNDQSSENKKASPRRIALLIFICIPVSPGRSRLIWAFPRNFNKWMDRIIPRWVFHIGQNLILDSDTYLLHVQEHKIMEIGPSNWQKSCYVPVKSDALVVGFRRWLNKYSGGQVNWGNKFSGNLPPTPPREQLLDRYWTHVVNCSSCRSAHKSLKILEVVLQVTAITMIGITAAAKPGFIPVALRVSMVCIGLLCFVASRWLSHFIYKTFHFHDYYHALI